MGSYMKHLIIILAFLVAFSAKAQYQEGTWQAALEKSIQENNAKANEKNFKRSKIKHRS